MKFIRNAAVAAAVACFAAQAQGQKLSYPEARKGDVVDDYHGTKIADPYRWMEDIDAKEVTEWVEIQNKLTSGYVERLPLREHFRKRITELWNYPKTGLPLREAGRLFYSKNSGLQRQSPVYMRENLDAEPRLVIDPNALSPDGSVSLGQYAPSPDGSLIAYTLSQGGADWRSVHVREIASGRDLTDKVEWMRFSGLSWTKDGKGFFYSRYPRAAQRTGARSCSEGPCAVLPPRRDPAVRGSPDLPTQGSAGLGGRRRRDRGWTLPARVHLEGF